MGQSCVHKVQPVQREESMVTLPFWIASAGQPNSRIHFLQEMQDFSSTNRGASGLSMAIQGDLNMIAFTPGRSAVRFTQETAALWSRG